MFVKWSGLEFNNMLLTILRNNDGLLCVKAEVAEPRRAIEMEQSSESLRIKFR